MKKSHVKTRIAASFLCLGLCLSAYQVFPSESHPDSASELTSVIKRIKEHEANLKTFIATFTQTKRTTLLEQPLESKGLIYFDSRGKMLLSVTTPSRVKILFDDNRMIISYPDVSETQERYLGGESIVKKYFGIGASIEEMRKQYALALLPKTNAGHYHLKLTPKAPAMAKRIDAIEVYVSPKYWLPERIQVWETEGDITSILLDFTSINTPLPPDIFEIDLRENH
jgi:outer membrane lipoprotein-sorting protein